MKYAAAIGVLVGGGQIIMNAVQPFPGSLVVKWCLGYLVQMQLLGLVVHKGADQGGYSRLA